MQREDKTQRSRSSATTAGLVTVLTLLEFARGWRRAVCTSELLMVTFWVALMMSMICGVGPRWGPSPSYASNGVAQWALQKVATPEYPDPAGLVCNVK